MLRWFQKGRIGLGFYIDKLFLDIIVRIDECIFFFTYF